MNFSEHFEVTATLYFRVHDAELHGGEGCVGYAKQAVTLTPKATLEDLSDAAANGLRHSMAVMLHVPPEKLEYITREEYERETEDDDDEVLV